MRRFTGRQLQTLLIIVLMWTAFTPVLAAQSNQSEDNPFASQFAEAYSSIRSRRKAPESSTPDANKSGSTKQVASKLFQLPESIQKPDASVKTRLAQVPRLPAQQQPTAEPNLVQDSKSGSDSGNFQQPSATPADEIRVEGALSVDGESSRRMGSKLEMFEQNAGNQFEFAGPVTDASPVSEASVVWWQQLVQNPLRGPEVQIVDTNQLVYRALARSPRIQAISQTPLIREQQVNEAQTVFDPVSFVQTQFQDRVDPVGDNLSVTNDGTNFLDDHIWTADLGVRRKTETGAEYEFNQRLGFRNSNSAFFNPQDQGTATLSLNVTQPLLKGRGRYYNRSQILIAQANGNIAWNTFTDELQEEIKKTVAAYWQLYFDRAVYLQKQRNVQRASEILAKLEGRAGLDSLPSQIARARAAVFSRKTDLANAMRNIRNSETELRRLTADSDWQSNQRIEMLPTEIPQLIGPEYDLGQVITTALENRPEIKETLERSRIVAVQRDISLNELLPELSLLFGTYVSTLQGESQLGDAFIDQFGGVKPGYSVGLEFELPFGNRAAQSRLAQRKLQLAKIKAEVDETAQNVIAESQIALRRVLSARETLASAEQAIRAAQLDLQQNLERWDAFALVEGDIAEGQTPTTVLDQLLDSQERLTAAELVYAQAELELKTSEVELQAAMGTLLIRHEINPTATACQ